MPRQYDKADFREARGDAAVLVAAHLMPDSDSQDRLPFVLNRIRGLIAAAT